MPSHLSGDYGLFYCGENHPMVPFLITHGLLVHHLRGVFHVRVRSGPIRFPSRAQTLS